MRNIFARMPDAEMPGGTTPGTRRPGGGKAATVTLGATAAITLLALTGCNQIDPLKRDYMWHATGVNEHNIAAMAVNPHDLVRGRDTARRRVVVELEGVERLWSGRPYPLPTSGGAAGGAASGGASGGGGSSSGGGT